MARDRRVVDLAGGAFAVTRGRGRAGADVVASLVASRLQRELCVPARAGDEPSPAGVRAALAAADQDVWLQGRGERFRGAGASVATLLVGRHSAVVGWVGDCRVYRWRHGAALSALTYDSRSPSSVAVAKRAEAYPDALLGRVFARPNVSTVPFQSGDVFVMCTAGATEGLDEARLQAVMGQHGGGPLEDCARALLTESDRGGRISEATVVLVRPSAP